MLLSHKKKFLFIHIQKTGGTSITRWLQNSVSDMEMSIEAHSPLSVVEDRYRDYFKVAFVRNPFDRLVSWYSMISKVKNPNPLQQKVLTHSKNFTEFILNCEHLTSKSNWKPFHYNQIDYLTDAKGTVAVDFIGKFEDFSQGIKTISDYLDIDSHTIGHINSSTHTAYQDYYTEKTRDIISNRFQRDLHYFNYTF